MSLLPVSVSRVCKECVECVASSENLGLEGPQSEQKEEEEEEEEEEEALCRNAGLAYSFALFELNPPTKTVHYSCIATSLPTTLHLASPSTMICNMIKDCFATVKCRPCVRSQVFTSSMRWPRQAGRHRHVRLLAALLASAPDALVLADARPSALLD